MPKITAITQQKKLTSRFSLFVDGKFETGIDGSLVLRYDLKVGDEFTEDLKHSLENDDRLEMAYLGLLNFIAYRERCEHEVHEWLFKKKYPDLKEELIERLLSKDYLNNGRFARMFIRDRVKIKSWGPTRIRHALGAKRIDKNIIENELEDIRDEYDFDQMALDLMTRKIKYLSKPTYKDKKRLWSFLQRRGYEPSSITAALGTIEFVSDENSELDK